MTEPEQPYPGQERITLICPPELKTRLMLRLANWATDPTGHLDPGVEVRVQPRGDRASCDTAEGYTLVSLAKGLFAAYGDPPFTGDGGQLIEWWKAPWAFGINPEDLDRH